MLRDLYFSFLVLFAEIEYKVLSVYMSMEESSQTDMTAKQQTHNCDSGLVKLSVMNIVNVTIYSRMVEKFLKVDLFNRPGWC